MEVSILVFFFCIAVFVFTLFFTVVQRGSNWTPPSSMHTSYVLCEERSNAICVERSKWKWNLWRLRMISKLEYCIANWSKTHLEQSSKLTYMPSALYTMSKHQFIKWDQCLINTKIAVFLTWWIIAWRGEIYIARVEVQHCTSVVTFPSSSGHICICQEVLHFRQICLLDCHKQHWRWTSKNNEKMTKIPAKVGGPYILLRPFFCPITPHKRPGSAFLIYTFAALFFLLSAHRAHTPWCWNSVESIYVFSACISWLDLLGNLVLCKTRVSSFCPYCAIPKCSRSRSLCLSHAPPQHHRKLRKALSPKTTNRYIDTRTKEIHILCCVNKSP